MQCFGTGLNVGTEPEYADMCPEQEWKNVNCWTAFIRCWLHSSKAYVRHSLQQCSRRKGTKTIQAFKNPLLKKILSKFYSLTYSTLSLLMRWGHVLDRLYIRLSRIPITSPGGTASPEQSTPANNIPQWYVWSQSNYFKRRWYKLKSVNDLLSTHFLLLSGNLQFSSIHVNPAQRPQLALSTCSQFWDQDNWMLV